MKAAIYSRKSKFTGKGESIENQVQFCIDYAHKLGIYDYEIYEDEGFSGSNINRPKFKKLLNDAKNKKFNYLICYRLDRISRNVSDFSNLIETLNKLNISFISIKEQFDTSTPMGRAMMYIASVFSQLERETIAERIKDNMYELAKSGRWLGGVAPLGFSSQKVINLDDNNKERSFYKLIPIEDEVTTVKLLYNEYLNLRSLTKLHKFIYNSAILAPNGKVFDISSIALILRNPVYVKANNDVIKYLSSKGMKIIGSANGELGILTYGKNTKTAIGAISMHSGIVPANIWLEVQLLLDSNKSKSPRSGTGSNSLLSGLLRCSKCGKNMRISYKKSSSGNISNYYYICGGKKMLGTSFCSSKNLNGKIIDNLIIETIKNKNADIIISSFNENKNSILENKNKTLDEINTITSQIQVKKNTIGDLVLELTKAKGTSLYNHIINQIQILDNEVLSLESDIESLNNNINNLVLLDNNLDIFIKNVNKFNENIDFKSIDMKRNLLSTIVSHIVWDSDSEQISIHYLNLCTTESFCISKNLRFHTPCRSAMDKSADFDKEDDSSIDQSIINGKIINVDYSNVINPSISEDTFGNRLRKNRIDINMSIEELANLCGVTKSVVNGYELNRYYPTKEVLDKLADVFNINYLCRDGYTKLLLEYDLFIERLKYWIKENNLTYQEAADNLGISRGLLRFWFDGSIIRSNTYFKIEDNLIKYNLI